MKTCPFKQYQPGEPLLFKNIEASDEVLTDLRDHLVIKIRTNDNRQSIEPIGTVCNESDCALWDEDRRCCSIVSLKHIIAGLSRCIK